MSGQQTLVQTRSNTPKSEVETFSCTVDMTRTLSLWLPSARLPYHAEGGQHVAPPSSFNGPGVAARSAPSLLVRPH